MFSALFFIGSVYREVRQSIIDMEQMFQLLGTKSNVLNRANAISFDPATMGTGIVLNNVRFAYSTAATTSPRPILSGASCEIPQGQTVAIVGSSGCGKLTTANAIVCNEFTCWV